MTWFERLFGRKAPAPAPTPVNDDHDIVSELSSHARNLVAARLMAREEIVQAALDYVEDQGESPMLRAEAERATDDALNAHLAAQAAWLDTTDCDRLDRAFAALEADGVIARQDFTCCGTCGVAEIWDQIDAAERSGRPARGFTFYHQQDTERAVDGDGVYLNYGACVDDEAAAVAIGHAIVARLNAHGLTTDWDGQYSRRIAVALDWKRRRTAAGAPLQTGM